MLSKKSLDFAGMKDTPKKGRKARDYYASDSSPPRVKTPQSAKRPRYFGHSPHPVTPKRNLNIQRKDITKLQFDEIDSEDDRFLHLILSYGYSEILQVHSILQRIPKNFTNRLKYFSEISKFVTNFNGVSEDTIKKIAACLDRQHIPLCNVDDVLWLASRERKTPYMFFLAPVTDVCIDNGCGEKLYGSDKEVTTVTLFDMSGPVPGLKCVLFCKACGSRYGIDKYRPRNGEARYYPENLKSCVVPASNKVYFTEDLFEFMCEAGNHGFVSAQAFSQTYISVYHAEHPSTKRFCEWKLSCFGEHTKPDSAACGQEDGEDGGADVSSGLPNPFMSRKSALEATFNGELEREVRERQLESQMTFKYDSCREANMKKVDSLRRTELYPHPPENCNDVCKSRGCQNLRVIDSCWKLCIPHCMLAVQTEVDGFPLLNFPNVCSEEPKPGSVFCEGHHQLLEQKSIPTEKGAFLKYLGCKENPQSQEDIRRVDIRVMDFMSSLVNNDSSAGAKGTTATAYQGTDSIIKKISPDTLNDPHSTSNCNKDTGEKGRLRQRARGHFAAVSGGGNILCFNPIYKSESPSQVFMLTIQMMYEELKDVPESELDMKIEDYILSYDNMCNLDKIKAANCDLPLPGKLKTMWQRIRKIVDRLHMKNHKSKCCQQKYNPDNVLKAEEDNLNTMAAEQLFAWMSRFKKIVNSMTQTHHLFYLHRMCQRRNRYTAMCRRRGFEPIHPGVNTKLN